MDYLLPDYVSNPNAKIRLWKLSSFPRDFRGRASFFIMNIETEIKSTIDEVLSITGQQLNAPLKDDTLLLGCGLDSLGFAILVARLEENLGYDPFVLMATPVYPKTFREFVCIYQQHQPVP